MKVRQQAEVDAAERAVERAVNSLKRENERLQETIKSLQARNMYCAFCGETVTGEQAAEHMVSCEKHPISRAVTIIAKLRALLEEWSDPCDCSCDTAECSGECLQGRTRAALEEINHTRTVDGGGA